MPPRLNLSAGVFAVALAVIGGAFGQRSPPSSGPPSLGPVVPPGCQRGTALEATLTGAGLADPLAGWLGAAGRVTLTPGATTGKDSMKIRARIEVPANAPLGMHRLRLATTGGLSNFRPFCVDALPEIAAAGENHGFANAQLVPIPCVVTGRVDAETSDYFRVSVTAGQRVSFEVLGRRLGSGLDPILRLRDSAGRELPGAYSDDAPGLQTDARLTHTFAAAGDYLVEVRDTTNKGGRDFWYRLRIGDFPCAVTPFPAAARRGTKVAVNFAGPLVEGMAPVEVQVPVDPSIEAMSVAPVGSSGLPGWPVTLLFSDHDEFTAPDRIGTLALAQQLAPPCGVTGRILRKAQKDNFVIAAKKGQRYLIAAQTAELLSPAEVYVTVRDGAGAELARTDPHRAPAIDFTAPADGNFFIVVEHLNYTFGPCEVYRLTVTPPAPGFELALGTDHVAVPQGQVALIPVTTLVCRDFSGPIELSVVGPPGLTGTMTVPAGVQAVPPPPDQPPLPPVGQLPIHASADLAPGVYEFTVRAKAVADGKDLVAFASTKAAVQAQMGGLAYPPREWLRGVGVAVTPKPPFSLAALWERPEAVRGLGNRLVVVATRDVGFDGEIALTAAGLPPGVTATPKSIPAGRAETAIEIRLADKAVLGSFPFSIVGRGRQDDREFSATFQPPPLLVALPFDLKIEPNPVPLETGGKAMLTVTAVRKGGYAGPIGLELRNLPAQVTAVPTTIDPGKTTAAMTLAAAADAPLGSRGDVDVLGTAPLGNQQAASPAFTVRVQSPPPGLIVKIEPAAVTLKPGGKMKVKVIVERKHFAGPVALTIEGLPAKVTAPALTVPPEQSTAEIELTATADAEPGKSEVTVTAKAAATATVKVIVQIEK
jgi:hypothetical protein